jgi:sodium transport system ATP-binding protein
MQEVGALCDEVIVIAHGTVVASGTPVELHTRTGESTLEDAFVKLIGTGEGLL